MKYCGETRVFMRTITGVCGALGRLGTANRTRQVPDGPEAIAAATTLTPPTMTWTLEGAGSTLFESTNPATARVTESPDFTGWEESAFTPDPLVAAIITGGGGSTCIK